MKTRGKQLKIAVYAQTDQPWVLNEYPKMCLYLVVSKRCYKVPIINLDKRLLKSNMFLRRNSYVMFFLMYLPVPFSRLINMCLVVGQLISSSLFS